MRYAISIFLCDAILRCDILRQKLCDAMRYCDTIYRIAFISSIPVYLGRVTDINEVKQQFLFENPGLENKVNQVGISF
jgi:hypothetical protein